jgi:DNA polymerase III epsilon subunit-like protein
MKDICFVDFETTGVELWLHHPIQIGAILADGETLETKAEFSQCIRPPRGAHTTKLAFRIHEIDLSALASARTPKSVLTDFFGAFGTNYVFGGWNIHFDIGYFRQLCTANGFKRMFSSIGHRHLDVQSVFQFLVKSGLACTDGNSLDDACRYFGISRPARHDALQDARATLDVYRSCLLHVKRSRPH